MTVSGIPLLDFSKVTDDKERGKLLLDAFESTGFIYILNHGIDMQMVNDAMRVSSEFFQWDKNKKVLYKRRDGADVNTGYVLVGMEKLSAFLEEEKDQTEIREAYNFLPFDQEKIPNEVPEFGSALTKLYDSCRKLSDDILDLLADALQLKSQDLFRRSHSLIGQPGNPTTLRTLYYPAVDINNDEADNLTRCGTHSDYGTITLLFQDDVGGLEVENRDGKFVPAVPVKDAVLVNLGDLLQRWTSDRLRSTRHRVKITAAGKPRQSMAFFVHPDDEFVVECLDGSGKYPPISAGEYLKQRFGMTY